MLLRSAPLHVGDVNLEHLGLLFDFVFGDHVQLKLTEMSIAQIVRRELPRRVAQHAPARTSSNSLKELACSRTAQLKSETPRVRGLLRVAHFRPS